MDVLVVDKRVSDARELGAMLDRVEIRPFFAFDAADAYGQFKREPYRFSGLITEQELPGKMLGSELADLLRVDRRNLIVLVLSTNGAAMRKLREYNEVLLRPFSFPELLIAFQLAYRRSLTINAGSNGHPGGSPVATAEREERLARLARLATAQLSLDA